MVRRRRLPLEQVCPPKRAEVSRLDVCVDVWMEMFMDVCIGLFYGSV